jgi:hypothetical protein
MEPIQNFEDNLQKGILLLAHLFVVVQKTHNRIYFI